MKELSRLLRSIKSYIFVRTGLLPVLFLLISLAFTFFIWRYATNTIIHESNIQFNNTVRLLDTQIKSQYEEYLNAIYAISGLFYSSDEVTPTDFDHFYKTTELTKHYPGLFVLAYYKYVKAEDKNQYERQMKKYFPNFAIYPPSKKNEYIVTTYNASENSKAKLMGFDISSEPVRKESLDRARDLGQPVLTPALTLLIPKQTGFLVFFPLYKTKSIPTTLEEKRKQIDGFVGMVVLADEFFKPLLISPNLNTDSLIVYDQYDKQLFIHKHKTTGNSQKVEIMRSVINQNGSQWKIDYQMPVLANISDTRLRLPNNILLVGFGISILLFLYTTQLLHARKVARDIAKTMTRDLKTFKLATDNNMLHIVITDINGKIIYANKAVEKTTGYSNKEIIGQTPDLWGGLMSQEFYKKFWKKIKEDRQSFYGEIENRRKNGEKYFANITVSPIIDEDDKLVGFVGIEEDITERIKAEKSLVSQTRKLRIEKSKDEVILENIGEGIIVTDENAKILLMNKAAEEMLDRGLEELKGESYLKFIPMFDSKGKKIPDNERLLSVALKSGKQLSTNTFDTYYYVNRKGQQFPVLTTISPIKNDNKIIGGISVFRDITLEKRIDQAKTEFVSLASHQLRTPLSTINWYTEMLLSGDIGKLSSEQHKYVKETSKASKRMVDLVNALLNVSRIELGTFVVDPKPMNIKEVLTEVITELQPLVKKKDTLIKVKIDVNNTYQLDRKLIHIIFQNLLSNALKYTPEKGKIEVSIVEDSKFVEIQVKDNGYGIPKNQGKLIFTKLFRADNIKDKESDGTGLGLYIVKSILDQTGGSIHFESEVDKGTTFFVKIPVTGMKAKKGARQLE